VRKQAKKSPKTAEILQKSGKTRRNPMIIFWVLGNACFGRRTKNILDIERSSNFGIEALECPQKRIPAYSPHCSGFLGKLDHLGMAMASGRSSIASFKLFVSI
jgi:hypothetical protein